MKEKCAEEILPQLFPLGTVTMVTDAFSAECGTNRERDRETERERNDESKDKIETMR